MLSLPAATFKGHADTQGVVWNVRPTSTNDVKKAAAEMALTLNDDRQKKKWTPTDLTKWHKVFRSVLFQRNAPQGQSMKNPFCVC